MRRIQLRYAVGTAFLFAGGQGAAAQNIDAFKQCARVSAEADRLACYDSAVSALDATLAADIAARRSEAASKVAQTKVDNFGSSNLPAERQPVAKEAPAKELNAKIAGVSYDSFGSLVARLDNDQTWVQTESQSLPPIKVTDEVLIKRGALGGYRMTITRVHRSFSVKRKR
jgi:hypothetical protein